MVGHLESLTPKFTREVSEGVICRSGPGLLRVGPIFVEVKTTCDTSGGQRGGRDLFELSLAEAACARQFEWRYHLVRLRRAKGRGTSPATDAEMEHIPNLSYALREDRAHLKLFMGIQR